MSYSISNFMNSSFGNSGLSSGASGSWFGNINFSDYASIRNGSYYNLLKTYYSRGSQNSDYGSSSSSVGKSGDTYHYWDYNEKIKSQRQTPYIAKDSANALSRIEQDAMNLNSAAKSLTATGSSSVFAEKTSKDADGNEKKEYNTDAIYKAAAAYVTEYNDLMKSAGSSKTGAIKAVNSSIMSYTKSNKDLLDSIGITVNEKDNTLSIDEGKFKSADMETAKKLFQGSGSYADKVASAAYTIGSHAKYEASRMESTTQSSSSTSKNNNTYNYWDYNDRIKNHTGSTAASRDSTSTLSRIQTDSSELTKAADKLESTGSGSPLAGKTTTDYSGNRKTEYDMDAAYKAVASYVTEYNSLLQSTGSSKVGAITAARSSMLSYTKSNASQLNEIGITINAKDNSLSIDKEKFQNADMETVQKLFQGRNSYASKVSSTASAIGDHAKYEAAKAATYNNTGAFSYNYASAWNGYI